MPNMTDRDSSNHSQTPNFDGSNWDDWNIPMVGLLREKRLWGHISGTSARPVVGLDAEARNKWDEDDDVGMGIIQRHLGHLIAKEVHALSVQSMTEWWTYLQKTYESKSKHGTKYSVIRKLRTMRFTGSSINDLREHFNQMIVLNRSLESIKTNDSILSFDLIFSLPETPRFMSIVDGIISQYPKLEDLTPEYVRDYFVDRLDLRSGALDTTTPSFSTTPSTSTALPAVEKRPKPICGHCKGVGHSDDRCWKLHPHLRPTSSTKFNSNQKSPSHAAVTVPVGPSTYQFDGTRQYTAPTSTYNGLRKDAIYVDSGCSTHVSPIREYFDDDTFIPLTTPAEIQVGDERTILFATHIGNINLVTILPNGQAGKLTVTNILYCPRMIATLLSTTALNRKGIIVSLDGEESCLIVKATREVIAVCPTASCNLPQLSATPIPSKVHANLSLSAHTQDINIAHRRLGHPGFDRLKRAVAKGVYADLGKLTGQQSFCPPCVLAKHSQTPFPRSTSVVNTRLALVHSDLFGGSLPLSIGKSRYLMTITDELTRYCWVYFLSTKDQTYEKFREWKAEVELATGERVKKIRSDNGGEYIETEFEEYLRSQGISHDKTVRGTPQQNGKAERMNKTLLEKGRAKMFDGAMSSGFWAEAVNAACYDYNRSPHEKLNGRTPYEKWFGETPQVSHMRPFGCTAYAHDRFRDGKLAPRSLVCKMLGYGEHTKGYRLWCPSLHRVIIERSVIFDETSIAPLPISLRPHVDISDFDACICDEPSPNPIPISTSPKDSRPSFHDFDIEDDLPTTLSQPTMAPPRFLPTPPTTAASPSPVPPTPFRSSTPSLIEFSSSPLTPIPEDDSLSPPPSPSPSPRPNLPPQTRRPEHERLLDYEHHPGAKLGRRSRRENAAIATQEKQWKENEREMRDEYLEDWLDIEFDDYGIGLCLSSISGPVEPPKTIRQVMMRPEDERDRWLEALHSEVDCLVKKGVLQPVDSVPPGKTVLNSSVVLSVKRTLEGAVERYKARLVADGRRQKSGIDYVETFAPVVKMASVRLLLALAAHFGLSVNHLDVETAFLYGELDQEIYMKAPAGFEKLNWKGGKLGSLWKLLMSIYGLKQASLIWNELLNKVLLEIGFRRLNSDCCIYVYRKGDSVCLLGVYVDDLAAAHNDRKLLEHILEHLAKHFKIKDLGPVTKLLGVEVITPVDKSSISLSQRHYIRELVEKYDDHLPLRASTPISSDDKFTTTDCPTSPEGIQAMKNIPYRELLGSLMYIMTTTRPDINYAINNLSRFLTNPGKHHWDQLCRVLAYLRDSEDVIITYLPGVSTSGNFLTAFTDSDWAGDIDRRRSTSGYVIKMCGGPIAWKSRLQSIIATSSTEAEFVATSPACQEIIWLRQILSELGFSQTVPTQLSMDNRGALSITQYARNDQGSRHIELRFHFIRECIKAGHISAKWISTLENAADVMTKGLGPELHKRLMPLIEMSRRSERGGV